MPITTANLSGVVINEVGTSPSLPGHDLNGNGVGDGDDEFIEIYNTSGGSVDISGWQLWLIDANSTLVNTSNGHFHTFAPGTNLGAGQSLVVVDPNDTSNSLVLSNSVYAVPEFTDAASGTPTFMSLTDGDIVVLYNPVTDEYVQFSGEDSTVDDQARVDSYFGSSTRIGPIEFGLEDNSGNSAQRLTDGDSTWVDAPQTAGTPNCFLTGTRLAVPNGETAVEDLQIGDLLNTADGRTVPVKWVGRQVVSTRFGPAERLMPVQINAGALDKGKPATDLTITSDHALFLDGVLVHAGAIANGFSIRQLPLNELGGSYTVYHVETDSHEILLANGVEAESFIDNVSRRSFDNYAEFEELYGDVPEMEELPYPRAMSARQVPESIRSRLAMRKIA
jgi:hypothetical protein